MKQPAFYSRILTSLKSLRIGLTRVTGTGRLSGDDLTIVCSSRYKTANFLLEQLFQPGYQQQNVGTTMIWNSTSAARKLVPDACLLFLEVGVSNRKLPLYGAGYLQVPVWVRGAIDLPLDHEITRKKDYKEQLRKIRKAGFQSEVATSRDQLEHFYQRMYLPQVGGSHGSSTVLYPRESIVDQRDQLELLLIRRNGEPVAGELISYRNPIPELHAVGVIDRDVDLIRQGALSACYHFGLQHLQQKGYSQVDVGGSRSLLHDGVLNYKRKWGQRVVYPYDAYLLTRILHPTAQTGALLKQLPVICAVKDELISLVFADRDELASLADDPDFIRDHHYPGTRALYAFIVDESVEFRESQLTRLSAA
jgi:hypothetical protein